MTDSTQAGSYGWVRRRWPVLVFWIAMIAGTTYAFAPRHAPAFPPSGVHVNDLLVTGLARQGTRIVAVGELGRILWTDSARGPWHEAQVRNPRGLTFTQVRFVAPDTLVAVGHGALIVRSTDGGETWQEVSYEPQLGDALLGVSGPFAGRLFAYGSFGLLETSTDGGKTWVGGKVDMASAAAEQPAAPVDPNADPFANYQIEDDPSTHHIYGVEPLADGSLLLVGERGLLATSHDAGTTWTTLPPLYAGSFFGMLNPTPGTTLIYGLGGHVYVTADSGATWTQSTLPQPVSIFGGTVARDGRVVLVGAQETVLVSRDGGHTFEQAAQSDRGAFDTVLVGSHCLLAGGVYGVRMEKLAATQGAASTESGS
ncbi:MAG: sialidase [Nevskiaceae bacterium]|nr:MAG: sialidase [Nevskiaceae bacterium]TBR71375.1 MAG: sialidase [Nevskiaceae bacterium]